MSSYIPGISKFNQDRVNENFRPERRSNGHTVSHRSRCQGRGESPVRGEEARETRTHRADRRRAIHGEKQRDTGHKRHYHRRTHCAQLNTNHRHSRIAPIVFQCIGHSSRFFFAMITIIIIILLLFFLLFHHVVVDDVHHQHQ